MSISFLDQARNPVTWVTHIDQDKFQAAPTTADYWALSSQTVVVTLRADDGLTTPNEDVKYTFVFPNMHSLVCPSTVLTLAPNAVKSFTIKMASDGSRNRDWFDLPLVLDSSGHNNCGLINYSAFGGIIVISNLWR